MSVDRHLRLAHGNGGRLMRELIEEVFATTLGGALDIERDAAPLPWPEARGAGELLITTDGFTVQPLEFPGGSIGSLAVHGTVNDLAVAGSEPLWLTLAVLAEEGLEIALLERIVADLAMAARSAGVTVLAGDTKVLPKGSADGLYLVATGVGVRRATSTLHASTIRPGDRILVSGPVGDHGTAVLLAREGFGLKARLRSDSASVLPLARAIWTLPGLRFMRDPTRGGLATVAHDIARGTGLKVTLYAPAIPVRREVAGVCEMLGFDPLYLACEGRVVAVVAPEVADRALALWREQPQGAAAACIGRIETGPSEVVLETAYGGERVLEELEDDPLPRIC